MELDGGDGARAEAVLVLEPDARREVRLRGNLPSARRGLKDRAGTRGPRDAAVPGDGDDAADPGEALDERRGLVRVGHLEPPQVALGEVVLRQHAPLRAVGAVGLHGAFLVAEKAHGCLVR